MSDSKISRPTPPILLIGLPVLAVALASVALYVALVRAPAAESSKLHEELLLRLTGLTEPTTNKLDAKFADADGDLLADVPTDPSKLVDPQTLKMTYIADDTPDVTKAAFKDFCAYLEKATGKKVEYVSFGSTQEELRALADGTVHIAGFNTGNVPLAVDVAGFIPVGMPADSEGNALYRCLLIAPLSSPVKTLQDIKDKSVLMTDAGSNSGYRAPLVMLKHAGLLPVRDYELRYSGSHDASIEAVHKGESVMVAAVASSLVARALEEGRIKKEEYREVTASEAYPGAALGYVYNLKPELAAKIKAAILSYDYSSTDLSKELHGVKFAPVNYKDNYALVRKIDDETGQVHKVPEAKTPEK